MGGMNVTIDRIVVHLEQADDSGPALADALRSVLVAELRRALAERAAQLERAAAAPAWRMESPALDLVVDAPAELVQMARALAQRIAWMTTQAAAGKGGRT